MTIVEFLEARLAEDEAVALTAIDGDAEKYGRWAYGGGDYDAPGNGEVYAPDASRTSSNGWVDYHYVTCDSEGILPSVEKEQAPHIARHDPARVLREVVAKRAMIAQFVDQSCMSCSSSTGGDDIGDCVARLLAAAYSDHPDFNLEWAS